MISRLLLLFTVLLSITVFSQEKIQKYSKAKIYYSNQNDLKILDSNGIAVDHGSHKKNRFVESVFSEYELDKATSLGYHIKIEIDDMSAYIANRKSTKSPTNSTCNTTASNYITPVNFELGTMGGFYTYSQMLQELDDMHNLYPHLITAKAPISTFLTFENRPIYSVKISDNPAVDEAEPEMMFSAIHHAREPASMQQLIFYMWYLLENYATNDEIKAIVDHTEQYFIPVLNPDGYVYNEQTYPNGGGMWRKNRRNNGDNSFGVDNNRNYSYHWNELGVSSTGLGQTWPGTAAFSEPENQAMKWFCEQHSFVMGINNHTHSGLLLYPFGYDVNVPTPEDDLFNAISGLMVSENGYTNQIAADLYPASGDSDDWMYGDTSTKNKIYAMTPEIGYSFWPAQNTIIDLCKDMMFHNLTAVHLITNHAVLSDQMEPFISTNTGFLNYDLQRLGLQEPANFTVSIVPGSSNIISVGNPKTHTNMTLLQEINDGIAYTLSPTIQAGDEIVYNLVLNNGSYTSEKEITKIYGAAQTVFFDNGDDLSNFDSATNWNFTTSSYYSATKSITDSPFGDYNNNIDSSIELANEMDLSLAIDAKASFYAKWDIEAGWDYVQFEVSIDNGVSWIPQCGKYTKTAVPNQGINTEPMYDGSKTDWVKEEIDLSDYLGEQLKFRFQLFSDNYTTGDGFYFDDFEVKALLTNPASVLNNDFLKVAIYPNPLNTEFTLTIPNLVEPVAMKIYSINGQLLKSATLSNPNTKIDIRHFSSGVYFLNLESNQLSKRLKLIKE